VPGVTIKFDRKLSTVVKTAYEKHELDVGVLQNTPHRAARRGTLTMVASGPGRQAGSKVAGTVGDVAKHVMGHLRIDFLRLPFQSKKNEDVQAFLKAFFELAAGRAEKKRVESALQAVVRNPILRGEYGGNSRAEIKAKGFSRLLIDTGQLFRAIGAKVKVRRVS
jgi:hypothetical protein